MSIQHTLYDMYIAFKNNLTKEIIKFLTSHLPFSLSQIDCCRYRLCGNLVSVKPSQVRKFRDTIGSDPKFESFIMFKLYCLSQSYSVITGLRQFHVQVVILLRDCHCATCHLFSVHSATFSVLSSRVMGNQVVLGLIYGCGITHKHFHFPIFWLSMKRPLLSLKFCRSAAIDATCRSVLTEPSVSTRHCLMSPNVFMFICIFI